MAFPIAIPLAVLAGAAVANFALQMKNYWYQKDVQRTAWGREDTSIQRRVADLRAAGLSPTLAAGQGASAGPIVNTMTPQMDSSPAMNYMSMLATSADIARTEEQTKLAAAQSKQAIASANAQNAKAATDSWDLGIYKERGLPSNASNWGKLIGDVYSGATQGPMAKAMKSFTEKSQPKKEAEAFFKKQNSPDVQAEFERRMKIIKQNQGGK